MVGTWVHHTKDYPWWGVIQHPTDKAKFWMSSPVTLKTWMFFLFLRCFRKISFPTVDSMAFWVEESIVGCRVVSVHSLRIFFCYYSKKNWLLTLVLSSLHVTLWGDFAFCVALCGLSRSDHMVHWWDIWKSREQFSSDRISTLCGTWHWSYLDRWSDMSRRGWQMIPLTGTQHCSVLAAFSIY
jgi:hypothetical protein